MKTYAETISFTKYQAEEDDCNSPWWPIGKNERMDIWKSWSIENASDFFNFDFDQKIRLTCIRMNDQLLKENAEPIVGRWKASLKNQNNLNPGGDTDLRICLKYSLADSLQVQYYLKKGIKHWRKKWLWHNIKIK